MISKKIDTLKALLAEVADLQEAASLLSWDQQTCMPRGSAEGRGNQLATLEKIAHMKFTDKKVGKLLDGLQKYQETLDPDSDDARLIKVTTRNYYKSTRVPTEMIVENAQVTAIAQQAWQQARAENQFSLFQPHLEKVVDLRRRYAELFQPFNHIYDPLLDDYEPGLRTAEVQSIFGSLRPQQVALIQAIANKPIPDTSFLHQPFDVQKQWDFGMEVITKFGFDWQRGRQDKSAHPFTQASGIDDVRLTTRVYPDFLNAALFGTMHETGHGLYDQGLDHQLARTPLATGASLGIHKSQSRMWENFVGRSLPFWEHFYPRLQQFFPEQLNHIDLETFYHGINRVQPSLIRVEADEATYNLHIMLRLELEIALLEGSVEIPALPEVWNQLMQDYLGITPPDDSRGVLQDIHWSIGLMGYFPTYALGNLICAQLWQCIQNDIPDLNQQIREGKFDNLLQWLRNHIHRHGAKFEPQELIQRITGSKLDPVPYLNYLQTKYGLLYQL